MDWNSFRLRAAEYFGDNTTVDGSGPIARGITPDNVLTLSEATPFLYTGPLDWTWGIDDTQIGKNIDVVSAEYIVQCNQAELLLSQAGALIERSLADLSRYDDLNVERFKILMEFLEFDKVKRQQDAEVNDPTYWVGLSTEQDLAAQARDRSNDNAGGIQNEYAVAIARFTEAMNDAYDKDDVARQNAAGTVHMTNVGLSQFNNQLAANGADAQSHRVRRDYEVRARAHQQARQDITAEIVAAKLSEMTKSGGALNYNERMREVGRRSLADFSEAMARMRAIALGLLEFYGIASPSDKDIDDYLLNSRTRVDGALRWLRKAANSLARAKLTEQTTVARLTLDKANLPDELLRGLVLQVRESDLGYLPTPRLHGVAASLEAPTGDASVDLELTSPSQKLRGAEITLPPVALRLGRVSSSASMNLRDISAPGLIENRSPIGDWVLRTVRGTNQFTKLHLDFYIVY